MVYFILLSKTLLTFCGKTIRLIINDFRVGLIPSSRIAGANRIAARQSATAPILERHFPTCRILEPQRFSKDEIRAHLPGTPLKRRLSPRMGRIGHLIPQTQEMHTQGGGRASQPWPRSEYSKQP